MSASALLSVDGLSVRFPVSESDPDAGWVHAVDDVALELCAGETLALVGESGCGKSTLARAICGLVEPHEGSVRLEGRELVGSSARARRRDRRALQMIFQDPDASLNPRMTIDALIREPLSIHRTSDLDARAIEARVCELLERVGLDPDLRGRYPHAFSGGQKQRIGIARALAAGPRVLLCDEVTSALDVSIQSQVLNLLIDLQRDLGVAILFITHDLAVVRHIADRIAVMYLGQVVEARETEAMIAEPAHPYTRGLLAAVPRIEAGGRSEARRQGIEGDIPSPTDPPPGCRFHTRCPIAFARCRVEAPPPTEVAGGTCRCFALSGEDAPTSP